MVHCRMYSSLFPAKSSMFCRPGAASGSAHAVEKARKSPHSGANQACKNPEKTPMPRTPALISTIAGVLLAFPAAAAAQDYPARPVRIIIPYAPGGINDVAARVLATHLTNPLGKQFIPDNRTGA